MQHRFPLAFAAALALSPFAAQATLMAIDFSVVSSIGGTVTGSGTAFTDSSNLDPGDFTINPADLNSMTMSLAGIPSAPASTSFNKVDLNDIEWVLSIDGAGLINDLNFFMRFDGTNADGYSIEGFGPFNFSLCAGAAVPVACAGGAAAVLDQLVIRVTDVRVAVIPEPLSVALAGLGLLGLGLGRRRAALAKA